MQRQQQAYYLVLGLALDTIHYLCQTWYKQSRELMALGISICPNYNYYTLRRVILHGDLDTQPSHSQRFPREISSLENFTPNEFKDIPQTTPERYRQAFLLTQFSEQKITPEQSLGTIPPNANTSLFSCPRLIIS